MRAARGRNHAVLCRGRPDRSCASARPPLVTGDRVAQDLRFCPQSMPDMAGRAGFLRPASRNATRTAVIVASCVPETETQRPPPSACPQSGALPLKDEMRMNRITPVTDRRPALLLVGRGDSFPVFDQASGSLMRMPRTAVPDAQRALAAIRVSHPPVVIVGRFDDMPRAGLIQRLIAIVPDIRPIFVRLPEDDDEVVVGAMRAGAIDVVPQDASPSRIAHAVTMAMTWRAGSLALPEDDPAQLIRPLDDVIDETIERAILLCQGNVTRAAQLLGISSSTIYRRRERRAGNAAD